MLPSSWEDTRAHVTQTGRHMLTHTLHSGDKGSAWEDSGQMLVHDTGGADLVTCGHLACGPIDSCFSCPVFWPIYLLIMSLQDSPKRQGHWILGFLPTRPLPQVLTSAVCMVALTWERREASRGFLYKKLTLPLSTVYTQITQLRC